MVELECPRCGHRNGPEANFCSSCGAAIERVEQDRPTIQLQLDGPGGLAEELHLDLDDIPGGGVLVVRAGPNAGSSFAIDKDLITAGRHPESDIFLDDITVSRRHAEVARVDGGLVVRDVGSLNGTYLNRERIDEGPLHDGDVVQVGKYKLVYLAGPDTDRGR